MVIDEAARSKRSQRFAVLSAAPRRTAASAVRAFVRDGCAWVKESAEKSDKEMGA
jgi:hypothetical protein